MKPISIMKNLNEENSQAVIELKNDSLNVSDILEELGDERIVSLSSYETGMFSIDIYKATPDVFINVRKGDSLIITKIDHNGEQLYFNDNEIKSLVKEE